MRCRSCMKQMDGAPDVCPHCGYTQKDAEVNEKYLAPGSMLGKYEIGKSIGAGGFGVTYVGWDSELGRKVAIKEYFPSSLSTRIPGQSAITAFTGEKQEIFLQGRERFLDEAKLLMQFNGYDGIVSVYDAFEANGTAYIIMEYLEGITLKQSVSQFGPMSEETLTQWIIPMALSLKFLHQQGYIHRDISPDNLMCMPDGTVKLIDFGAARYAVMEESHELSVIVKQGFTPIEQYQSHGKQGPWTDIYAIGATMYYGLTGKIPPESLERLNGANLPGLKAQGAKVSERVEDAVMTALNVQPEDRPQDLDKFIAILMGEEAGAVKHRKKSRGLVVLIAAIGAMLAAGAVALIAAALQPGADAPLSEIIVPSIIGDQQEEAQAKLEENMLHLSITGAQYYDAEMIEEGFIEAGAIMSQDPESGTVAEEDDTVGAEISKGKTQVYPSDVEDMLLETATEYLSQDGVEETYIQVEYEETTEYLPGTVMEQSADGESGGEQSTDGKSGVDFDTEQVLVVAVASEESTAAEKVYVRLSDYTGRSFDDVRQELLNSGVYTVKSEAVYSDTAAAGTIISQYPAAGIQVQTGEAVYVTVSLGREMARVPDVQYLSLEDAEAALLGSGLGYEVVYAQSDLVAEGHVIAQSTETGTQVDLGSQITLTVSGTEEVTAQAVEVTLDAENLHLTVGETAQISATYTSANPLTWVSTNASVADVSMDGEVTALRYGSAAIAAGVDGEVAICRVFSELEDETTQRYSYMMEVGETRDLSETLPDDILDQVVWRTGAPSVISVSEDGEAEALETGYACVTASCADMVYQFVISVEADAEYVKIAESALYTTCAAAEQALLENGVGCQIVYESSTDIAKDEVVRIDPGEGFALDGYYYLVEGSSVTLYVSSGPEYIEILKTELDGVSSDEAEALLAQNSISVVTEETYSDTAAEGLVVGVGYTGKEENGYYYIVKGTVVTLTVSAGEDTVQSIKVSTTPTKMYYTAGDTPVYTGMVLTATYKSGKTEKITTGYSASSTALTTTNRTVTITYGGVSTTLTFYVSEASKASTTVTPTLEIQSLPSKTTYTVGDTFSSSGLTLRYMDENANTTTISNGYTTSSPDMTTAGTKSVTVSYKGLSQTFSITVSAEASLRIASQPTKTTYTVGDTFSTSGLTLSYTDTSGTTTTVSSGFTTTTPDMTTTGTKTVVVSYKGLSVELSITVQAKASLSIKTLPATTAYYVGDTFSSSGLTLSYTDTSGTTTTVSSGFTTSVDMTTAGTKTVTVSYKGLTASFEITVNAATEPKLEIASAPTKTEYWVGDALLLDGLSLRYTDSHGKTTVVTDDYDWSEPDMDTEGTKKVTVYYEDLEVTFSITVQEPSISIYATEEMCKVLYSAPSGTEITVTSSDPSIAFLDGSDIMWESSGTVTFYASMTVNWKTYTASVTVSHTQKIFDVIEEEESEEDNAEPDYYFIIDDWLDDLS